MTNFLPLNENVHGLPIELFGVFDVKKISIFMEYYPDILNFRVMHMTIIERFQICTKKIGPPYKLTQIRSSISKIMI